MILKELALEGYLRKGSRCLLLLIGTLSGWPLLEEDLLRLLRSSFDRRNPVSTDVSSYTALFTRHVLIN